MSAAQKKLKIAEFSIDPALDEISIGSSTLKIEPRAMRVLLELAARPGEVVSIEELLERAWSDLVVTSDSVYQAVAALRRAFGDDPKTPRYIVTVPRRGYRLVAPVSVWAPPEPPVPIATSVPPTRIPMPPPAAPPPLAESAPTRSFHPVLSWSAVVLAAIAACTVFWMQLDRHHSKAPGHTEERSQPPAPAPDDRTIAVLPFVDMSEKRDHEYFSDGLSEELIGLLAQSPDLKVTARTSSFYFKAKPAPITEIARTLGVAHILEGSVRMSGNTLRVSAQLIRGDTGVHTWSANYEREFKEVFKVQDEIADAVVAALRLNLTPRAASGGVDAGVDADAYNDYLLGLHFNQAGNLDGFRRAAALLKHATQLDPRFAQAYAAWAFAECAIAADSGSREPYAIAQAALEKALVLAPDRANGYAARAWCRGDQLDFAGALADAEHAVALDPGDARFQIAVAFALASNGRVSDAIGVIRKAIMLDPLNFYAHMTLGRFLTLTHDWGDARSALERAREINPTASGVRWRLGVLDLRMGHADAALADFENLEAQDLRLAGVAMAAFSAGREQESQSALDQLIASASATSAYLIGMVYAWRGDDDRSFEWLERARRQRDSNLSLIKYDPLATELSRDPRYRSLLRELKLPE